MDVCGLEGIVELAEFLLREELVDRRALRTESRARRSLFRRDRRPRFCSDSATLKIHRDTHEDAYRQ